MEPENYESGTRDSKHGTRNWSVELEISLLPSSPLVGVLTLSLTGGWRTSQIWLKPTPP